MDGGSRPLLSPIDRMALPQQCSASRALDRPSAVHGRRSHGAAPHSTARLAQAGGRRRLQAVLPHRPASGSQPLRSSGSSEAATATVQAPQEAAEVKAVLFDMVSWLRARVGQGWEPATSGDRRSDVSVERPGTWHTRLHAGWSCTQQSICGALCLAAARMRAWVPV